MLPKEAIEEFRMLYRNQYNKELTEEDAVEKANRLFGLYRAVYTNTPIKVTNTKSR